MKILIIGKTGQLGSALIKDATSIEHNIISPSRQELDILDKNKFLHILIEHKPDIVINTAAFLDVYLCEKEPENAFKYNCIAVSNMAEICSKYNIRFITISTDYVFNGKKNSPYLETDIPIPIQIYGISKLAGEFASLLYDNTTIIRTCGLYGNRYNKSESKCGKGNFVDNRIKDSCIKDRIEISNEETICPTFTGDLSKAILQLIQHSDSNISGIFHLVNEGQCSWHEFSKEIFNILDIHCEVVPIKREGFFGGVRKPLFSVLKNERAFKQYNIQLPHWKDALKRYLKLKYS